MTTPGTSEYRLPAAYGRAGVIAIPAGGFMIASAFYFGALRAGGDPKPPPVGVAALAACFGLFMIGGGVYLIRAQHACRIIIEDARILVCGLWRSWEVPVASIDGVYASGSAHRGQLLIRSRVRDIGLDAACTPVGDAPPLRRRIEALIAPDAIVDRATPRGRTQWLKTKICAIVVVIIVLVAILTIW